MNAARILVVGRHAEIMARVHILLESGGYTPIGALTNAEALQQMATGSPEALLIGGGVESGGRAALIAAFAQHRPGRPVIEHAGGPHGLLEHLASVLARRMPVLFLSHGAATLTMDPADPTHLWLRTYGEQVRALRPAAVLVCSAHDVRPTFTLGSADRVSMMNDHPAAAGRRWSARGSRELADVGLELVRAAGLPALLGRPVLDHGAWVPLSILFPDGDIPVVTLSLSAEAGAETHHRLGAALAPLRREGVWVLASGGATHSQATFRRRYLAGEDPRLTEPFSAGFDGWLEAALTGAPASRLATLRQAPRHPDYGKAHPTPDQFLPILLASGAAGGDVGARVHTGYQHALSMAAYQFG